jgi:hypothetical protein
MLDLAGGACHGRTRGYSRTSSTTKEKKKYFKIDTEFGRTNLNDVKDEGVESVVGIRS